MIKRLVTGTILGLAALTANAQETESGWIVGLAAGFADYSLDNDSIDDSSVGFQATAQYRFNRWFGVEAAYLNSGELEEDTDPQDPSSGDAELTVDGFSFTAIGYVPVGSLDLYGKAGFYTIDQDLEIDESTGSGRKADGLTAGGGIRIPVSDQFSIRTEGNWYDLEDAEFWIVNLGVDYRFGK